MKKNEKLKGPINLSQNNKEIQVSEFEAASMAEIHISGPIKTKGQNPGSGNKCNCKYSSTDTLCVYFNCTCDGIKYTLAWCVGKGWNMDAA